MKARGEAGDHDQHGVAEHVAVEHAAFAQALGPRGDHVLLVDLIEEGVLGQHGEGGEAADHHGETMGSTRCQKVVRDAGERVAQPAKPEIRVLVRQQAAQREPVEVAAAGEDHQAGRRRTGTPGIALPMMTRTEVQMSKRLPSRTALATPRGIEIR